MTATADRVGYFVQRGGGFEARNRHFWKCRMDGVPVIVVQRRKNGVYASVDTLGVDPSARMDATADVKIRAVFGQAHGLDDMENYAIGRSSFYSGDVPGGDVESVGTELAAIVEEALPFIFVRWPIEGRVPQSRRPDWRALAEFYASHARDPQVSRAIRLGYCTTRGVKDTHQLDYQGYCDLAGRPVIQCDIRRSLAVVSFKPSLRIEGRPTMPESLCSRVEELLSGILGFDRMRSANVGFRAGGPPIAGAFFNIPASVAERLAFELSDLAVSAE